MFLFIYCAYNFFIFYFYRTDLANKVRRRGYKLVGELLSSTKQNDADGSNVKKGIAEKKDALVDLEDKITGQYVFLLLVFPSKLKYMLWLLIASYN